MNQSDTSITEHIFELAYYKSGIFQRLIQISSIEDKTILIGRKGGESEFQIEDSRISKNHASLYYHSEDNTFTLEDLSSTNSTYYNNSSIKKSVIGLNSSFCVGNLMLHRFEIKECTEKKEEQKCVDLKEAFKIKKTLLVGRANDADIKLSSPNISKYHARITNEDNRYYIEDTNSTNGTYINSRKLSSSTKIKPDDIITIGNFELKIVDNTLTFEKIQKKKEAAILVRNVSKIINGKGILNKINLTIGSSELVGIMGPSGCGKTSLLKVLNGYDTKNTGDVFIHGLNLKDNYQIIKTLIGYVPQDDIVHKDLSVYDALYYGSKLRLSSDLSKKEIQERIFSVLKDLRILDVQNSLIKNISGGERKRVSIAMELLSDPSILFLDEPTSPLDPQSIKDFLEILKDIALSGKTIVMVTHKPEDLTFLSQVAFLAKGGYLAYFGDIHSYLDFFNVKNVISVYSALNIDNFKNSENRMDSKYQENEISISSTIKTGNHKVEPFFKQFFILLIRMMKIKMNDRLNTILLLIQSPLIALLMGLIFNKTSISSLFIMVLSAIWFGCNNSARDIVSELSIYKRERMFNLRIDSYITAKLATATMIAFVQIILFVFIINIFLNIENGIEITGFLILISTTSILLGLLLSSIFDNTEKVMTIVPLILIPQIMFSGIIEKIEKGLVEKISYLTIARWGMEGISLIQGKVSANINEKEVMTESIKLIGFKDTHDYPTIFFALFLISCIYYFFLLFFMHRKDFK